MISVDTIVALSSASGPAARMILRVSGADSSAIASRFWTTDLPPAGAVSRGIVCLCELQVPAWLYRFRAPRSYTGEDLIELHIPGNPLLATRLLEELLRAGARLAEPGEFTARAYFNAKLDLTQAEGITATIAASNEQELSAARRLMAGELAPRVAPAVDLVAQTLALLEAGIDFSDEGVTFISPADLLERIHRADAMLEKLLFDSMRFERLAHEPRVVLAGRPNAGKSTLLNALAGHDRAIVSPIAGTTRDVLCAQVTMARGIIQLTDVAGLEEPSDPPMHEPSDERARIADKMREHALRALREADHVVLVQENSDDRPPLPLGRAPDLSVRSKIDLPGPDSRACHGVRDSVDESFPLPRYSGGGLGWGLAPPVPRNKDPHPG